MPEKLIKTTTKTFTGIKLTKFVNEQEGTLFDSITEALAGMGVSAIGYAIATPIAAAISTAIGLGLGVNAICEAIDYSKLSNVVADMDDDDKLEVTTRVYEYTSNSQGNIVYYCKMHYRIVFY